MCVLFFNDLRFVFSSQRRFKNKKTALHTVVNLIYILMLLLLVLQLILPSDQLFEERFSANYSRQASHDCAPNNNGVIKKNVILIY